ncbi:MAG: 3-hydroxyacyl-CoA dehydrogenase family protein [Promethearchaeota archaeon]|nr:MAG: 3-hydroxyacyl-CoA dehydrogenase family protein [Candidatus Lokiarchaeota archaeon]
MIKLTEDIKNIVVVGAGLMGAGIAQVSLMAGYKVTLVDIKEDFINKGVNSIESGLKRLEEKGELNTNEVMSRLTSTLELLTAVKNADFVIEAVVEKMDVKKEVFKICDEHAPSHCIIATNTSTMSITEMASATKREEQCIGMHFFNPVPLMRLIEIIAGQKSSNHSMDMGVKLGESLPCLKGKRYVVKVLKDRPGFIVNRLNAPVSIYRNYLLDYCYDNGIPWEQLDADYEGKVPMLPCILADYVGIDTSYYGALYYVDKLSPDFTPGKVITQMVKEGKLGRKTGQGFYDWSQGRPNPDTSKKANLVDFDLINAIKLNEGCRLLEEGVTNSYNVIDEANMAGRNTPGPFDQGKDNYQLFVKKLEDFVEETGKKYLKPCKLLRSGKFLEMK